MFELVFYSCLTIHSRKLWQNYEKCSLENNASVLKNKVFEVKWTIRQGVNEEKA